VADLLGSYRGQRLADYAGVVGKRKIWVFTSQKAAVLAQGHGSLFHGR
jgi:hypothetical protein